MVWNYIWSASRVDVRTIFIQHFSFILIFCFNGCRYCKFCWWQCTLYFCKNTDEFTESLEKATNTLAQRVTNNFFKGNKCHLIVSENQKTNVNIGEYNIECSYCEKLLWVMLTINWRLITIFLIYAKKPVKRWMY